MAKAVGCLIMETLLVGRIYGLKDPEHTERIFSLSVDNDSVMSRSGPNLERNWVSTATVEAMQILSTLESSRTSPSI
jgi:hypothetical protein